MIFMQTKLLFYFMKEVCRIYYESETKFTCNLSNSSFWIILQVEKIFRNNEDILLFMGRQRQATVE